MPKSKKCIHMMKALLVKCSVGHIIMLVSSKFALVAVNGGLSAAIPQLHCNYRLSCMQQ